MGYQNLQVAGLGMRKLERTHSARRTRSTDLRMSITDVIGVARTFLKEDAGYDRLTISSVVAIEPDSKWKVIAEISGLGPDKKEVIVDDKDGKVISYKQA